MCLLKMKCSNMYEKAYSWNKKQNCIAIRPDSQQAIAAFEGHNHPDIQVKQ